MTPVKTEQSLPMKISVECVSDSTQSEPIAIHESGSDGGSESEDTLPSPATQTNRIPATTNKRFEFWRMALFYEEAWNKSHRYTFKKSTVVTLAR